MTTARAMKIQTRPGPALAPVETAERTASSGLSDRPVGAPDWLAAEPEPWLAPPFFPEAEPPEREPEPPDADVVLAFVKPADSPRTARPAADRASSDTVLFGRAEAML